VAQHHQRAGGRLPQGRYSPIRRRRLDQRVSPVADRAFARCGSRRTPRPSRSSGWRPGRATRRSSCISAFTNTCTSPTTTPPTGCTGTARRTRSSGRAADLTPISSRPPCASTPAAACLTPGCQPVGAHAGLSTSWSGSLIEQLDRCAADGLCGGCFGGWNNELRAVAQEKTVLGHPRVDFVAFGFFHPLMALTPARNIVKQVEWHRGIIRAAFGVEASSVMFPPETAFHVRMIPALNQAGVKAVIYDSIHRFRACQDYPYAGINEGMLPPNPAEQDPIPPSRSTRRSTTGCNCATFGPVRRFRPACSNPNTCNTKTRTARSIKSSRCRQNAISATKTRGAASARCNIPMCWGRSTTRSSIPAPSTRSTRRSFCCTPTATTTAAAQTAITTTTPDNWCSGYKAIRASN